ncbi:MAG: spermidine/putrescine ABC transporter substrate-binding protein [Gammaproteobacteria bacterium]
MNTTRTMLPGSFLALLFLLLPGFSLLHAADANSAKQELVFLNWSEYMDPALIKRFEELHHATVTEIYFESDDYRDNYMLETQGKGIDVIVVNGIQMRSYVEQGWLAPLSAKEVPNLEYIDKKWLTLFADAEGYAVPLFWGTSGIVYRKDLVGREIRGYRDLFNPDEAWRGKIVMVGSSRDVIGAALKALGYSLNSTSFEELEEAKQQLMKQKPFVKEYAYITLDETSSLVSGDAYISMIYSGDALMLQEHSDNIEYVVPEEGSELWIDHLVVSQASRKKNLAYQFVNFLNEPENAAQLAKFVYYATPNMAAEKLLPQEYLSDKIIYPPKEVLDKSEIYTQLPPRVTRIRNEIFLGIVQ